MIVVQGPGLYEVLGELGVGEEVHGVRHNLNIAPGKLLQLEVNLADLDRKLFRKLFCHQLYSPGYQKDSSEGGRCNGISCHVSGSW